MMRDYESFVRSKSRSIADVGIPTQPSSLSDHLFQYQKDIVAWALTKGRAAIFADCGMGKTLMQLEWASRIPGRVLILAPLAVGAQTVIEGAKFGYEVVQARASDDWAGKITIANYEMMSRFDPSRYQGVVLDESSILKSVDGSTRAMCIESFSGTPYRLACTATPSPNDVMELANHAEFLSVMPRSEMLATYFVHDGGETQKWRLKGHAVDEFWRWVCEWALMIKKPSDLGYSDEGFTLPKIEYHHHTVRLDRSGDGYLISPQAITLDELRAARKSSIPARIAAAADIVRSTDDQWLVWCGLNQESSELAAAIPGSVEVTGSDDNDTKTDRLMAFSRGDARVLITKPKIAGFGMNWQNCRNVVFVGLSHSFESYYQAIRRCWRFGQLRTVNCHIITSDAEGSIISSLKRKERIAETMGVKMVEHMMTARRDVEIPTTSINRLVPRPDWMVQS